MRGTATRQVLTLPNVISVLRLTCAPAFVWLLVADRPFVAGGVLAALGASDWVDGWVARRFDQGSELGKVLDPVADRVLLLTAGAALLVVGGVPAWYGGLVLAREVVIALATLALAAAGARRIDVQWVGKAGTLLTMFSLPCFLIADAVTGAQHDAYLVLAWCFAVPALALSYYAAVTYIPLARRALREGRHARAHQSPSRLTAPA